MNLIHVHLAQLSAKQREQEIAQRIELLRLTRPDTVERRRSSLSKRLGALRRLRGMRATVRIYKAA